MTYFRIGNGCTRPDHVFRMKIPKSNSKYNQYKIKQIITDKDV